jgi:predicted O-methyltransferase YrrM
LNYFFKNDFKTIVELGTSRSFVDGKFPGCNEDNLKYWEPENPEKWDWSAGCFTRLIGEIIQDTDIDLITVDLDPRHIRRSKIMTEGLSNIEYYVMSSEQFLSEGEGQIDFLYMDTGDMTPIENTAQLHLRESKLIVEKNLISDGGLLLIDDVRSTVPKIISNEESDYGKAKYSIPYLQKNGFELVMDEYQVVLRKS